MSSGLALHPVRLAHRRDEAVDLVGLRFTSNDAAHAASFTQPGQFVVVRVGGHQGYFALASRPGEEALDLLVKAAPESAAGALAALSPGDEVQMSHAQGAGYPIDAHAGKHILLFAVGSGISPIRSLVWWLAAHRAEFASVTLFYGARTRAHVAFREELAAWREEGIEVKLVLSREAANGDPHVAEGYVQSSLAGRTIDPATTVAFVCGMADMVAGVRESLAAIGMGAEALFQNY